MSANRASGTSPEMRARQALFAAGVRGYRLNLEGVPGRPDIAFTSKRVAVFVNGCFWHSCPKCALPLPKGHREFWAAKFERNRVRDARKIELLEGSGWSVVTLWECDLRRDLASEIDRVRDAVSRRATRNRALERSAGSRATVTRATTR